jgi:hypothetical protein
MLSLFLVITVTHTHQARQKNITTNTSRVLVHLYWIQCLISWIILHFQICGNNQTLEKTKGAIKNGHSRETGNIRYTRHKTKTNKTKNTKHYVLDTTMLKQTQMIISNLAVLIITWQCSTYDFFINIFA